MKTSGIISDTVVDISSSRHNSLFWKNSLLASLRMSLHVMLMGKCYLVTKTPQLMKIPFLKAQSLRLSQQAWKWCERIMVTPSELLRLLTLKWSCLVGNMVEQYFTDSCRWFPREVSASNWTGKDVIMYIQWGNKCQRMKTTVVIWVLLNISTLLQCQLGIVF